MVLGSAAGALDAELAGRAGAWLGRGPGPPSRPGSAPPPPAPVPPHGSEFASLLPGRSEEPPPPRCYSAGGQRRSAQPPPSTRASVKSGGSVSRRGSALTKERPDASCCEWFAAALGNLEWLRFSLNLDLKGIVSDHKGFTAIHFAAQKGKLESLRVLVEEYEFPVDLRTKNGQTPLHLVIHKDNKNVVLPCIQFLLEHGASLDAWVLVEEFPVDLRTKNSQTPLHLVIHKDNKNVVLPCIHQTRNGYTPLHLAAREGLLNCVKVLVRNGANVHARDAIGCKPIDYCKIWNHRVCARFLKDAMWKRDKKDFACEMGKLKRLKGQLAYMEQDYQTECQREQWIQRQANFKKWFHSKLPPRGQSLTQSTRREPRAPPWAIPVSKIPKLPQSFHLSPEKPPQQIPQQPNLRPLPTTARPLYNQPRVRQPKPWNISNNPASSPTAQLHSPQAVRMGVHPDPSPEHDFRSFLRIRSDGRGGAQLRTVAGRKVSPVPRLPLEVIVRELHPQTRPCRMKVPQGFQSVSIRGVDRKRYMGDNTFWTDALAMNLRETFDETFVAAVQAHQGLPTPPCPRTPPCPP